MTTESIDGVAAAVEAARMKWEHWHDPEHPEFGALANWMESTEDGWFQLTCAEDSQASIATYGAFSTLGDGSRLVRCTEYHGDPLAAIVEHLAAVVVLAEAAGDVEDMHIVEAMVFDALKWACRIAATKESE